MSPGILQHLGVQGKRDQQKRLRKSRWGLAVDVGFGDVDVFGALRVEGMEVLWQWVQERKEEEKSEIVKKDNAFKVFSIKESRVRGEVGQES